MLVAILAVLAMQGTTAGPPLSPVPHTTPVPRSGDATVLGRIGAEDANELEVAKLASTKASAGDAKTFAATLVKDHQQSLVSGTNLAKRYRITRLLPDDSIMARTHKQEMAELNVLTGAEFDKAFMKFEFDGHKASATKDSALVSQAVRASVKLFAQQRLPVLAKHRDIAEKWIAAHP